MSVPKRLAIVSVCTILSLCFAHVASAAEYQRSAPTAVPSAVAQGSAASQSSGWKCAVGLPLAEAAVNTAQMSLNYTVANLPKAELRLVEAQAKLVAANEVRDTALKAAAGAPADAALAAKAKEAGRAASAAKATVKTATAALKAVKAAIPRLTTATTKATAKLIKLQASCK